MNRQRIGEELPAQSTEENRFEVLENGNQYFPSVFAAIAAARHEVIIETFILFDDRVGKELHAALVAAARRGVAVDLTVDGFGSPDLSDAFIAGLADNGVRLHIYAPSRRLFGMRTDWYRRLHRKIVAIDGQFAYIGGINFCEEQLTEFGEKALQDYAARIEGPLARDICDFARGQVQGFTKTRRWWSMAWRPRRRTGPPASVNRAILVIRDNNHHRDDIERHYRAAVLAARHEIVIACAYFFPGFRLLRALRDAARRGVAVRLILQGNPDMPQVKQWATMLYPYLLEAGVQIYEYCLRPLHAKVAVVDSEWSTIGSSNLDPLSLALNLEANIIVQNRDLNRQIRVRLEPLLREHCRLVDSSAIPRNTFWQIFSNFVTFHGTRHFPRWAGWLPGGMAPKVQSIGSGNSGGAPKLAGVTHTR